MRELRVQHEGRPFRVLYAIDARRIALLLIAGDKTGNDRWYETFVPLAGGIYEQHLKETGERIGYEMALDELRTAKQLTQTDSAEILAAGSPLSTRTFKASGLVQAMKALFLQETQIAAIRSTLQDTRETLIEAGGAVSRIFSAPDLVAAGFEPVEAE